MCLEIIKYPAKAIEKAKKSKNMNKTLTVLIEAAVIFGIAAAIVVAKLPLTTGLLAAAAAASFISGLLLVIVAALFLGLVLHTVAGILGGKGEYYNALTTVTFALTGPVLGILIAALLSFIPVIGVVVGFIVLALTIAHGISVLYKGTKDLYGIDMVTTLVIISVMTLAIIGAVWLAAVMNITSFGSFGSFMMPGSL